jgi:cytochrome b6-f complex iron-sulfur subunit
MANAAVSAEVKSGGVSRREFLYYIWGASIALYAAQFTGLLVWFLLPKFREGEFGGRFIVSIDELPSVNASPANMPAGRFWLVNLDTTQGNALMKKADDESKDIIGVAAIYKVCTHLGCIYTWTAANDRFECPCHGSKYRLDGRRIESPAPRTLDRFRMEFLDADKKPIPGTLSELVDEFYAPVLLPPNAAFIRVDTGDRQMGPRHCLLSDLTKECP